MLVYKKILKMELELGLNLWGRDLEMKEGSLSALSWIYYYYSNVLPPLFLLLLRIFGYLGCSY